MGYSAGDGRESKYYAAAFLILIQDGKVLLQRRKNTGHEDGNYGLPSGHVEPGELATESTAREVAEEIGITVQEKDLRHIHSWQFISDRTYFNTMFTTEKWEGEIHNAEPEKCDDVSWFPLDALPENTIHYIRTVLERIQQGESFTEIRKVV